MPPSLIKLSIALLATAGFAASDKPHADRCDALESAKLRCYDGESDTSQRIETSDIIQAAEHIRSYGEGSRDGGFLTMHTDYAPPCTEWAVYRFRTVLVLAKHTNVNNSRILYTDIANTMDGGEDGEVERNIYDECDGTVHHYGGSSGVVYDPSNPAYHDVKFKNGDFTPKGITIRLVHNPYNPEEEKDDLVEFIGNRGEKNHDLLKVFGNNEDKTDGDIMLIKNPEEKIHNFLKYWGITAEEKVKFLEFMEIPKARWFEFLELFYNPEDLQDGYLYEFTIPQKKKYEPQETKKYEWMESFGMSREKKYDL